MPSLQSEAIVLRTLPLREADLLVTLFTRSHGKVRGVAKSALKSKKRFGGALEPLTVVAAHWEVRSHELVRIDSCEVMLSPMTQAVDYLRAVALGHVAESLDQLLPDHEANDAVYRLALAVLQNLHCGAIWMPLTYFDLWMTRLTGLLPELHVCRNCGTALNGAIAWFHPLSEGLMCQKHKRMASIEMSADSRQLAAEMLKSPITLFVGETWQRTRCEELRRFLHQRMEGHLEKKLLSAATLEKME